MNANLKDLTGIKKNRWTFIKYHCSEKTPSGGNTTKWWCKCDCSDILKSVSSANILNGSSKSCGCWSKEVTTQRNLKHGQASAYARTREYSAWKAIKTRCYNKKINYYKDYGGRGIYFVYI